MSNPQNRQAFMGMDSESGFEKSMAKVPLTEMQH